MGKWVKGYYSIFMKCHLGMVNDYTARHIQFCIEKFHAKSQYYRLTKRVS